MGDQALQFEPRRGTQAVAPQNSPARFAKRDKVKGHVDSRIRGKGMCGLQDLNRMGELVGNGARAVNEDVESLGQNRVFLYGGVTG